MALGLSIASANFDKIYRSTAVGLHSALFPGCSEPPSQSICSNNQSLYTTQFDAAEKIILNEVAQKELEDLQCSKSQIASFLDSDKLQKNLIDDIQMKVVDLRILKKQIQKTVNESQLLDGKNTFNKDKYENLNRTASTLMRAYSDLLSSIKFGDLENFREEVQTWIDSEKDVHPIYLQNALRSAADQIWQSQNTLEKAKKSDGSFDLPSNVKEKLVRESVHYKVLRKENGSLSSSIFCKMEIKYDHAPKVFDVGADILTFIPIPLNLLSRSKWFLRTVHGNASAKTSEAYTTAFRSGVYLGAAGVALSTPQLKRSCGAEFVSVRFCAKTEEDFRKDSSLRNCAVDSLLMGAGLASLPRLYRLGAWRPNYSEVYDLWKKDRAERMGFQFIGASKDAQKQKAHFQKIYDDLKAEIDAGAPTTLRKKESPFKDAIYQYEDFNRYIPFGQGKEIAVSVNKNTGALARMVPTRPGPRPPIINTSGKPKKPTKRPWEPTKEKPTFGFPRIEGPGRCARYSPYLADGKT